MKLMPKILLLLSILSMTLPMALAFSVNVNCPDTVEPNADVDCTLNLNTNGETVNAFQFKVSVPDGFTGRTPLVTPPATQPAVMTWNSLSAPAVVFSLSALEARDFAIIHLLAGTQGGNIELTEKVPSFTSNTESITISAVSAAGLGEACNGATEPSCASGLECSSGNCKIVHEAACTQSSDCVSNNCAAGICCAVNEENVAGKCVLSSEITGAATGIAAALRDNVEYRTFLQKIARIAFLLRDLLG